jgi:hypothetical protein
MGKAEQRLVRVERGANVEGMSDDRLPMALDGIATVIGGYPTRQSAALLGRTADGVHKMRYEIFLSKRAIVVGRR